MSNHITVEALVAAGIPQSIAENQVAAFNRQAAKSDKKKGRKGGGGGWNKRTKINVPVVMDVTCLTCKREWQEKTVITTYDDQVDDKRDTSVGMCPGCVDDLYDTSSRILVGMLVLAHHPNNEIRRLSMAEKRKLAEVYSGKEMLSVTFDTQAQ